MEVTIKKGIISYQYEWTLTEHYPFRRMFFLDVSFFCSLSFVPLSIFFSRMVAGNYKLCYCWCSCYVPFFITYYSTKPVSFTCILWAESSSTDLLRCIQWLEITDIDKRLKNYCVWYSFFFYFQFDRLNSA